MITSVFIFLCFAFSLYAWNGAGNLAFSQSALIKGDYYTLLTAIFVHANWVHLIGNVIFLYVFGSALENEVGELRTAAVFLTGGVLSFIFSIPFYPDAKMVGASAAIFAVMATVLLVRRPGISLKFLSPLGPIAVLFFIFNIAAIGSKDNVAYISHLIGFVIGLFFGIRWNEKWKQSLFYTLVLLAIYIVLYNYLKAWLL